MRGFGSLLGACVRLLWTASRGGCVAVVSLFVVAAAAQAGMLLALKVVLEAAAGQPGSAQAGSVGQALDQLLPGLALLGAALAVLATTQLCVAAGRPLLIERTTWFVFERVLDVARDADLRSFDDPEFHDRLNRAQNAGGRPLVIVQGLLGILGAVTALAGLVAVVMALQPLLIVSVILLLVPLLAVQRATSRSYHRFATGFNQAERFRYYLRSLLINRSALAEVRAYDLEPHLRERGNAVFDRRVTALRRLTRTAVARSALGGVLLAICVVASLAVLFGLVAAGQLSYAGTAVGAVAVVQIAGVLNTLALGFGQLHESSLFVEDYRTFVRAARQTQPPAGQPVHRVGRIELKSVRFSYPRTTRPALDGVDLIIEPGQVVALVGANGSGKTTLAKILCGLYRPDSGEVTWDGADLTGLDETRTRRMISVMFQDYGRYLFTVAENISIGDTSRTPDDDSVRSAARRAGAHEFVLALPDKYDTQLGTVFDGGVELSVGQWQRLALARVLFRDAPLVVLDEPTAALDPQAERRFFDDIVRSTQDKTTLLISHRFSTVRAADVIYVLDGGQVVEVGSHDQLMREQGLYCRMYTDQAQAYQWAENSG
ncbi:hypothetical protein ALI144C_13935 [Actinosynnema sp. ALI-1.44]|nr:hypothetical protein ALI144C_13935 [Actinosynnema sp. ALI-1.44]